MGALDGKVAVVTGAGRGIGRGEALALAAEGAAVVVNDVDHDLATAVVAEITGPGGAAVADARDVADWSGAAALVDAALASFGRLDVLVNNAGFLRDRMSFSMDEAEWDDVVRVHLKGHFAPSRAAAAHWRERAKAGDAAGRAIVNTVSEAGLYGGTGQANYVAAKAGHRRHDDRPGAGALALRHPGQRHRPAGPHAHDRGRPRRLRRATARRRLRRVGPRQHRSGRGLARERRRRRRHRAGVRRLRRAHPPVRGLDDGVGDRAGRALDGRRRRRPGRRAVRRAPPRHPPMGFGR